MTKTKTEEKREEAELMRWLSQRPGANGCALAGARFVTETARDAGDQAR